MKELEIPEIINDQFVIEYFSILRKPSWSKLFLSRNENRKRILEYLLNRFKDTNESTSIVEIVYRIINHLEEVPKCIICGRPCAFGNGIYSKYCSKQCSSSKDARQLQYKLRSNALLKNYGVENVFQLDSVKEKIKQTNLERYGFENPNQNKDIKQKAINTFNKKSEDEKRKIYLKAKETNLKKYGPNNYANREKAKKTFIEHFGVECPFSSDIIKQKIKQSNLERYGVENVFSSDIIKQKIKQTNLERYGQESCMSVDEIKNKAKQTYIERYGGYWMGSDIIREKAKQTCIEKYGGDQNHAECIVNKRQKTCMERYNNKTFFGSDTFRQMALEQYGVENFSSAEEIKQKRYNTLEKNGYLNEFKSQIEINIEKWLIGLFGEENVKYNYIDKERYPWRVDFYLKPYDIFIEIQGYWTHGTHPFDKNDKNDIEFLHKIQIKERDNLQKYGTTSFTGFIETWTVNDVKKRKLAYKNNLKYLEIFSSNFEICKNAILEFINKNTSN